MKTSLENKHLGKLLSKNDIALLDYHEAVQLIALEDEPECLEVSQVSGFVSVQLISDIFNKSSYDMASDVVKYRLHLTDAMCKL